MRRCSLCLIFALGCSDYGLKALDDADPAAAPDSPEDVGEVFDPPPEEDRPEIPITVEESRFPGDGTALQPPCSEEDPNDWDWLGSAPFSTEADPTDGAGRPFYHLDYDESDLSAVVLPDEGNTPQGTDKVYRAHFRLTHTGQRVVLSPQSDDGLWLYLNGELIGHWGGDWQEEGCVNDDAGCVVSLDVDPVDISEGLQVGDNVIAARVSNPVMNAYFDLVYDCQDD